MFEGFTKGDYELLVLTSIIIPIVITIITNLVTGYFSKRKAKKQQKIDFLKKFRELVSGDTLIPDLEKKDKMIEDWFMFIAKYSEEENLKNEVELLQVNIAKYYDKIDKVKSLALANQNFKKFLNDEIKK